MNQKTISNSNFAGFALWQWLMIIFYGTLVGVNESFIGGMAIPYRSIIVNVISISLLSLARFHLPKSGSSFLIIVIAILYKLNNLGFHSCTANVLLCNPLALAILGISYEMLSFTIYTFVSTKSKVYLPLTTAASALLSFTLFGITNTFILGAWEMPKLINYIFFKGFITAVLTSVIVLLGFSISSSLQTIDNTPKLWPGKQYAFFIVSILIVNLWIIGSLITF
ncbi:MAG TPA: hypothetical protein PK990_06570 [Salinivirgaceae bacterium]|nr:hypothetical protein [Salinivirgaceae bacterium]